MLNVFQAREIMEICLMTRNRFDYIVKKVGVQADVKKAAGRGSTNLYSYEALFCFAIAQAALLAGWNHEATAEIIQNLKKEDEEHEHGLFDIQTKSEGEINQTNYFSKEHKSIYVRPFSELGKKKKARHEPKPPFKKAVPQVLIRIDLGELKSDLNGRIKRVFYDRVPYLFSAE
jgi:hypothetical protein